MRGQLEVLFYFVRNNLGKALLYFFFAQLDIPKIGQNLLNTLESLLQHMQASIFQLLTQNDIIRHNLNAFLCGNRNQRLAVAYSKPVLAAALKPLELFSVLAIDINQV